ncbi:stage IV sporulation protein FB [Ruminiclostridium hungatei]|uniref:Stage IV sporulation protein FB n=1 Tax=Ruminiclostridium hungatei TaxID=48256 RepID=A0A1V4SFS5_RUMHU|nr:M50 family metallopeptidase [Ruminiclostridium hungatei]OPX42710.1 stage IV sporulation protein FB [Ruminiclostridium hungatei]
MARISLSISRNFGRLNVTFNLLILVFAGAAALTGYFREYIQTLFFIFVHEAGHLTVGSLLGAQVCNIRLLPVGLNAGINMADCTGRQRIAVYTAGPCTSFLLALIFFLLYNICDPRGFFLAGLYTNLYLGGFNLIPILPLDGGKIIQELLAARLGILRTGKVLKHVSVLLSAAIIAAGLAGLFYSRSGVNLMVIGVYFFMCMGTSREETAFMNIKSLLFRKSRVIRKGIYPVREIVALKHMKLSEVIKALDYIDRFHIINVLDEDMRVIKVMTEQEVLEAILSNPADTTFDNLMQIEYNVHNEVN